MIIETVNTNELIKRTAEQLKKQIQKPAWSDYVKTGAHNERPPSDRDWWYVRAAAVLRAIAKLGPIGVSKLRTKYGGARNRGVKPEQFRKGSGAVIRKILQQLEKAQLIKQDVIGKRKGRVITAAGKKLLQSVAKEIQKEAPKPKAPVPVAPPKKEEPKPVKQEPAVEKVEKPVKKEEAAPKDQPKQDGGEEVKA